MSLPFIGTAKTELSAFEYVTNHHFEQTKVTGQIINLPVVLLFIYLTIYYGLKVFHLHVFRSKNFEDFCFFIKRPYSGCMPTILAIVRYQKNPNRQFI